MSYANATIKSQQAGGAFTFATLPTASQMIGESVGALAYTSDTGLVAWNGSAWQKVAAPLNNYRTKPLRVVTFGDSTANAGGGAGALSTPENQDWRFASVNNWQSGTVLEYNIANRWFTYAFYPQVYLVGNGGIDGQTTAQLLARDTLTASSTRYAITDMLNLAPDVVLFRGGSVNDLTTVTSATLASTVASTYANHISIINRFASENVFVIDSGNFGWSASATDIVQTRAAIVQLNTMFAAYAAANPSKVTFINPVGVIADSTGAFLPNMAQDGIHPNFNAMYLWSQLEASALAAIFGTSSNCRYLGTNVYPDPFFLTTTNQSYGTVSNSVSIAVTNGTRSNAKIQVINNQIFQTCDFTSNGAGNLVATIQPTFNPSATGPMGIQPGDIWGIELDVYYANIGTGNLNIAGQVLLFNVYNSVGSGRVVQSIASNSDTFTSSQQSIQYHLIFAPQMFGDSSSNFTTASNLSISLTTDGTTKIRVGIANVRYVKLPLNTTFYQGTATLTAGTVTISNTNVQPGSKISVTQVTPGGTPGALYVGTITAGTSFVINSTSALDTSVVRWEIVGPNS